MPLVFLPLVLIATAIVSALWVLLRLVDPRLQVFLIGVSYDRELYTLAFALLSAGLMVAGYRLLRRHRAVDLGIGALLWWVLLALLTAFRLPGSSYAFALPAFFALVMVAALLFMSNRAASMRMLLAAEVVSDTIDGNNQRQLQLRLTSPSDAAVLIAHLSTTGQIVAAAIEGRPMDDVTAVTPYSALNLSFYAVAGDGVELTLTLAEPASVTVAMEAHTYALPVIDQLTIQPRPHG